ncbi:endoribonuclease YSH1-like [Apium graveolens]|uniref:endoribonuclease YSH1-like n=1 Tax=Apium graveolens TaxID=4045 RepID=UPI003D7B6E87
MKDVRWKVMLKVVLGAAMFYAKVEDASIVYTVDYNMTPDRYLGATQIDRLHFDLLKSKSTYGITTLDSKYTRKREFLSVVRKCLSSRGKVFIRTIFLGQARERCTVLEDYWERMSLKVPIYFSARLTFQVNMYYKVVINSTSQKVKDAYTSRNSFDFKHVCSFERSMIKAPEPRVLFATPGMICGGFSLDVFKHWAPYEESLIAFLGMVMTDHLTLCVDHLVSPESLQSLQKVDAPEPTQGSCSKVNGSSSFPINIDEEGDNGAAGEEEPLIQTVECRICQEEDNIKNLEVPCSCNDSLKFAHRKCVQRWCNEKGDITYEIYHQPYQSGYTAPPPRAEDTTIDISGAWTIAGSPLELHDPRLLPMTAAERHLLEAGYDEYDDSDANGAAFCCSAALILMALLLLRHALTIGDSDSDDDDACFESNDKQIS